MNIEQLLQKLHKKSYAHVGYPEWVKVNEKSIIITRIGEWKDGWYISSVKFFDSNDTLKNAWCKKQVFAGKTIAEAIIFAETFAPKGSNVIYTN